MRGEVTVSTHRAFVEREKGFGFRQQEISDAIYKEGEEDFGGGEVV